MKPVHKNSRKEPAAQSSVVYISIAWLCFVSLAYGLLHVLPSPRMPDPVVAVPAKPQDQKD